MKYTIEGFSQEYATTLKKTVASRGKEKTIQIDCTDLVILRWFVDFYPHMDKITVDGREYVWLSHKKLLEDLPLLDISKRACIDRMQKLVEFKILDYKLLKKGGTFSLYTFGENYINLVKTNGSCSNYIGVSVQSDVGSTFNQDRGSGSNNIGVGVQPDNKDKSIKYSSIKDNSIKDNYIEIVSYLNEKAGTKYKPTTAGTKKHINARLEEGFTVEDFKTVIDKKCAEWKGTDMEKYLRPETLFGTKFDGYLNTKVKTAKPKTYKRENDVDLTGIL